MVPHENVLNGEHGSMPHMEGTCDVWRWEHNRERLRIRRSNTFCNTSIRTKKRRSFPLLIKYREPAVRVELICYVCSSKHICEVSTEVDILSSETDLVREAVGLFIPIGLG